MNFLGKYVLALVVACPCILASAQCNRQTDVTSSIATETERGRLPSKEEQAAEAARERCREREKKSATTIQASVRGLQAQKAFAKKKKAATTTQKVGRGYLAQNAFANKKQAAQEVRNAKHIKFQKQKLEIQAIQDFMALFGELGIVKRSEWNIGEMKNNEFSEAQLESKIHEIQLSILNLFKIEKLKKLILKNLSGEDRDALMRKLGQMQVIYDTDTDTDIDHSGLGIEKIEGFIILIVESIKTEITVTDEQRNSILFALGKVVGYHKQRKCQNLIPDIISVPSAIAQATLTDENTLQLAVTPIRGNRQTTRQGNDDHTAATTDITPSTSLDTQ
jgi:hypothetical protein